MQTPSVGRIVHFVGMAGLHDAAIVTQVMNDDTGIVSLCVFPAVGAHAIIKYSVVQYDARMSPGTWHYPEHVGTVQWHESEDDEASKREGPISNSLEDSSQ